MKKILCFTLIVLLLATLISCAPQPPLPCRQVLSTLRSTTELSDGREYFLGAETPSESLTREIVTALFDESVLGYFSIDAEGKSAVDDCAVFLSSKGTGELHVFRCSDSRDTSSLARLCLARLDLLRHRADLSSSDGRVAVVDNYVILAACPNSDRVISAARGVIK